MLYAHPCNCSVAANLYFSVPPPFHSVPPTLTSNGERPPHISLITQRPYILVETQNEEINNVSYPEYESSEESEVAK